MRMEDLSFVLLSEDSVQLNRFSRTKPNFNPYTQMRLIQSIYSTGGTRGHIKIPLSGTKSIRKTQFGFKKIFSAPRSAAAALSMNVCVMIECVCVRRSGSDSLSSLSRFSGRPHITGTSKGKRTGVSTLSTSRWPVNSVMCLVFAVK